MVLLVACGVLSGFWHFFFEMSVFLVGLFITSYGLLSSQSYYFLCFMIFTEL